MRLSVAKTFAGGLILESLVCHALLGPDLRRESSFSSESDMSHATDNERDKCAQKLLSACREVGQVGSMAPRDKTEEIERLAGKLKPYSDPKPARQPLTGLHNLVYSAATSPASGRLVGPFYGKVTQEFVSDMKYINSVRFGPLEVTARANREIVSDNVIEVEFQEQTILLFGKRIVQKQFKANGKWKYLFYGKIQDCDGNTKLIRVMETPSLFVIEQAP